MAELRRLLMTPERLAQAGHQPLQLERKERHYLERVLRLRSGSDFAVADGYGRLYVATLLDQGQAQLKLSCQQSKPATPQLVLLLGLMRKEVEITLRMATELGVDQIVPMQAERSQISPGGPRRERWSAQLREASEQCERLWMPKLEPLTNSREALSQPPVKGANRWIGVTRQQEAPLLQEVLKQTSMNSCRWEIACGPEGGWSPGELEIASLNNWQPVSLGPSVLRASTAAVAALSLLQHYRAQRKPTI